MACEQRVGFARGCCSAQVVPVLFKIVLVHFRLDLQSHSAIRAYRHYLARFNHCSRLPKIELRHRGYANSGLVLLLGKLVPRSYAWMSLVVPFHRAAINNWIPRNGPQPLLFQPSL